MPSLFTRIITGDVPGEFIMREPLWVAFLDIKPTAFGHALLVPRQEGQYLTDLAPEVAASLGGTLARLTRTVKTACGVPAVNVVVNDGPEAGQIIPHAHLHVIPRSAGDNRRPFSVQLDYPAGQLALWGERLRAAWSA